MLGALYVRNTRRPATFTCTSIRGVVGGICMSQLVRASSKIAASFGGRAEAEPTTVKRRFSMARQNLAHITLSGGSGRSVSDKPGLHPLRPRLARTLNDLVLGIKQTVMRILALRSLRARSRPRGEAVALSPKSFPATFVSQSGQ